MTITILKAVLVIVILCVMIMLLLGISHLSAGSFGSDQSEIDDMRNDLDKSDDVITDQSVFRELVKARREAGRRNAAQENQ